jgi:hypothetical protein
MNELTGSMLDHFSLIVMCVCVLVVQSHVHWSQSFLYFEHVAINDSDLIYIKVIWFHAQKHFSLCAGQILLLS